MFLGAFTYGIVYTVWLKRRSTWNIVIGGLAGSFAVLAGAAAVDPAPQVAPVVLAVVLFLWTPPHFWSLAAAKGEDYARAGVPMLPVVVPAYAWTLAILSHTIALVGFSLVPLWFGKGLFYGLGAGVGGACFIWKSVALYRRPSKDSGDGEFLRLAAATVAAGRRRAARRGGGKLCHERSRARKSACRLRCMRSRARLFSRRWRRMPPNGSMRTRRSRGARRRSDASIGATP